MHCVFEKSVKHLPQRFGDALVSEHTVQPGTSLPLEESPLASLRSDLEHQAPLGHFLAICWSTWASFPGVGSFLQEQLAYGFSIIRGPSLVAPSVKNLPAAQVTQVQFLGWEDPLEKEMANHSSVLA